MASSPNLFDRVVWASEHLEPVEPTYCIAWEDPAEPDAPLKITTPTSEWLAMALHGGLLPPPGVYQSLAADETGRLVNGWLLHNAPPVGPMTEQEALTYIVLAHLPRGVWQDAGSNRTYFKIIPRADVPSDRSQRNSWRLAA